MTSIFDGVIIVVALYLVVSVCSDKSSNHGGCAHYDGEWSVSWVGEKVASAVRCQKISPQRLNPKGTPPQTGAERRRRRRAGAAASPVGNVAAAIAAAAFGSD